MAEQPQRKNVKILSKGSAFDTLVLDEHGTPLTNIQRVLIDIDAAKRKEDDTTVILFLTRPTIEVIAEALVVRPTLRELIKRSVVRNIEDLLSVGKAEEIAEEVAKDVFSEEPS